MAVTMARGAWTDERLDDLKQSVDAGFAGNREEFRAVRADIQGDIRSVRGEIGGVRDEMRDIRMELGALNRTIHQFLFAVVGTIFLGFMGTIAALITLAGHA